MQSANVSQRPVRTSASDAISSPARCGSRSVPARRLLDVLEAVDEAERRGVEERELLFHGDGEVRNLLERGLGGGQQLLVADLLLVAHRRKPSPE